jgi:hypothetical protein
MDDLSADLLEFCDSIPKEERDFVKCILKSLICAGFTIHKGECEGFLEKYIRQDAKGSPRGAEIPRAGWTPN